MPIRTDENFFGYRGPRIGQWQAKAGPLQDATEPVRLREGQGEESIKIIQQQSREARIKLLNLLENLAKRLNK